MDDEQGGITRRRSLLAAGFTAGELRRSLRRGDLVPVRRGVYRDRELPPDPESRHAVAVWAALADVAPGSVVSHVSAAVLHGIGLWGVPLGRVHVSRNRRSGARRGTGVHVHAASLEPDEVVVLGGIAVTSVARTVSDLARSVPFEQAVVVVDGVLRRGLATPDELARAVERAGRRPGGPAARRAVAFADRRSESVGESRSRVALHRAGLPVPVPQWEVCTRTGRCLGYVDFGWPQLRTVGEFDGRVKYGRLRRPGQEAGDVVFAEKRREDAIRDTGLRMVRWTWADLSAFGPVADRLRHAFR